MVYTVTLNPSLDYVVAVDDFRLGHTNRTGSERLVPGGKGLNVSAVLMNLGIQSTALGFVAGFTGDEVSRYIESLGINNGFIRVKEGLTRINLKLKSIEGTEINGQGPKINKEKIAQLMEQLDQLEEGDVLFLSGSIPASMPEDIYQRIMKNLDGRSVKTVVDATGNLLLNVLPYRPFLIKPNNHELSELFQVELKTRAEVLPYGRKLQQMGAKNVLISLAGEGAVLLAEDGTVHSSPVPKGNLVNGVGAGDAMLAAFMYAWMESRDYGRAFRWGLSAGCATAYSEKLATRAEIEAIYREVRTMNGM